MLEMAKGNRKHEEHGIDELLTVRDVQALTKLGRTTLSEAVASGDLPALRFGRAVRFRQEDVRTWMERHASSRVA